MKEKLTLEMKMDEYLEPAFYFFPDDNTAIRLAVENYKEITKITGFNKTMLDALQGFAETMSETLRTIKYDMTDLYKEIKALKEA